MASPTTDALLELWLTDLRANDLALGTVRRYRSAIQSFLAWYNKEEQRHLTLEQLSPIILIAYRNILQRIERRATSTVNGHISTLRTWCAWLTEEHYLEINLAKLNPGRYPAATTHRARSGMTSRAKRLL